jgi:hypothetical protein
MIEIRNKNKAKRFIIIEFKNLIIFLIAFLVGFIIINQVIFFKAINRIDNKMESWMETAQPIKLIEPCKCK